jgi:superfamily I DNA and/or RNA helicase
MDYFNHLLDLLSIERAVDKKAYQELTASSSAASRRANGLTWYPIAIRGTELSKAEYLTVEVERVSHTDIPHQLRFGASAQLFSNHDPKQQNMEGTLVFVGGNRLKISLRTDELPDWASEGKLGIDLLFDDNSYEEMQQALKKAKALPWDKPEARLPRVLIGQDQASFSLSPFPWKSNQLNAKQAEAVQKILSAQDLMVVHGPPGTGKTTTLVQAVLALIESGEKRILVTAPSNTAVDLLSEKIAEAGVNVVRIGNPARVSDKLMSLTLDARIQTHASNKEIKMLKKRASEFKEMAHKYKRNFGKAEREQRKALFHEAYAILKETDKIEQFITEDILEKAEVITATLVGCNHYTIRHLSFDTIVLDEAGQALEPGCWIPILKGRKLILAGDPLQLPPTIKSEEAARKGLSTTLLEKCMRLHPEAVTMLEMQYRMNASIMGFASKEFYQNKLQAPETIAHRLVFSGDKPLVFLDTAGCGMEEVIENKNIYNPEEGALLFRHLLRWIEEMPENLRENAFPSIAIISPYREQLSVLKEQFMGIPELQVYKSFISINTIDSFQGQERDVVYLSMTRSNTEGGIGFLSDTRRMNVAMTRARKKLVVIGDSATLGQHRFYSDFIEYAEGQNGYESAWGV